MHIHTHTQMAIIPQGKLFNRDSSTTLIRYSDLLYVYKCPTSNVLTMFLNNSCKFAFITIRIQTWWGFKFIFIIAFGELYFSCCFIHLQCVFSPTAQDDWNGTPRPAGGGKAPAQRPTKPGLREHPYGQY